MPARTQTGKTVNVKKILENGINFNDRFISDYKKLGAVVDSLKSLGYKISMTQGVWDMLHVGHLKYLSEAKSRGDILIVGVDSDIYTKQRKGPTRPVVPEKERLEMLAGIRCIDILTLRTHKTTPEFLVEVIRPDVLIVSSTTKDVGAKEKKYLSKFCGEIVSLDAQATISTTSRLRKLLIDGASSLASEIQKTIEGYLKK